MAPTCGSRLITLVSTLRAVISLAQISLAFAGPCLEALSKEKDTNSRTQRGLVYTYCCAYRQTSDGFGLAWPGGSGQTCRLVAIGVVDLGCADKSDKIDRFHSALICCEKKFSGKFPQVSQVARTEIGRPITCLLCWMGFQAYKPRCII